MGIIWRFMRFEEYINCFLKHILVILYLSIVANLQNFHHIRVFIVGHSSQNENPNTTENLFLFKLYQIHFCVCLSLFLMAEFQLLCLTAFSVISMVSGISNFLTWPDFWLAHKIFHNNLCVYAFIHYHIISSFISASLPIII